MAKRTEKQVVTAHKTAVECTPVVPRTPTDGITLWLLVGAVGVSLLCVSASWVLLLPTAHEKGIQADREAEIAVDAVPVATLPPLVRTKTVTPVGPEVTANPNTLGKPNPFSN